MATSAQITMNTERVLRALRTAGYATSAQQAQAVGIDVSTWSRLLNNLHSPSPKVIAGVLRALPAWPFDELFEVTDDEPSERVPQVA